MLELLLIELALCAAVIMVAAVAAVMRWRRSSDQPQMPVAERRRAVAELVDERIAQREIADMPASSLDTVEREHGAHVPSEPGQAAQSQLRKVADPELGPDKPCLEPDEQPGAAGAVTISERIAGYYDEADRVVADYLAAQGWDRGARDPCPRAADAQAASASPEAAADPGKARPDPIPGVHPGSLAGGSTANLTDSPAGTPRVACERRLAEAFGARWLEEPTATVTD